MEFHIGYIMIMYATNDLSDNNNTNNRIYPT